VRTRWLPYPTEDTDPEMIEAMLLCQGDWWLWGSSMCKKPEQCIAERGCYFVDSMQRAEALGLPRHGPEIAINPNARIVSCRSCGQAIWWGKTVNAKRNPYDVVDGQRTAISHFTTCPDARQWSKHTPEPVTPPEPVITWIDGVDGFAWAL